MKKTITLYVLALIGAIAVAMLIVAAMKMALVALVVVLKAVFVAMMVVGFAMVCYYCVRYAVKGEV